MHSARYATKIAWRATARSRSLNGGAMKRRAMVCSVAACIIATTGIAAPSASHALSNDETFTFLLDTKDYYYGSDRESISLAKDICGRVKKAKTRKAKERASKNVGMALRLSGWSFDKSNQFVSTAVAVYCPGQSSYITGAWVDGFYP